MRFFYRRVNTLFTKSLAMQKTSLRQKIALIILGLFLCVILLEIGMRIGGGIFLFLQEYRNIFSLKQKGILSYKIMCLGESTTALGGNYLYSNDSWPTQLEEILNQGNFGLKFTLVNKAINGGNTSALLSELESNLDEYKPDMVITMMGINDIGTHMPYKSISASEIILFFRSFRIYKLARLLCLHIVTKANEIGINKIINKIKNKKSPDDKIRVNISNCLSQELVTEDKESNRIEETLKKDLEKNHRDDRVYVELGRLYRDQGKFIEVIESLRKAIELNPANDEAYAELGWFYGGNDMWEEATESVKKAIELNPKNDWAYVGLGKFYREQGKFFEAELPLKKAIELNPKNDWAYFELGWVYREQGKFIQAEEMLKKALQLNLINDRTYMELSLIYKEFGSQELMEEYYKKANEIRFKYCFPMTVNNYRRLKEILDKRGIKLVCVQYPMRSIEPLKNIFKGQEGVIFVDNERVFKDALRDSDYKEYFTDMFGGDFGHCTPEGNRLLAENIANVILGEVFRAN